MPALKFATYVATGTLLPSCTEGTIEQDLGYALHLFQRRRYTFQGAICWEVARGGEMDKDLPVLHVMFTPDEGQPMRLQVSSTSRGVLEDVTYVLAHHIVGEAMAVQKHRAIQWPFYEWVGKSPTEGL